MLSITKTEADQLRYKLLSFTAVRFCKKPNTYNIHLLHENGSVYFLRRLDGTPYTTSQLDTAQVLADGLGIPVFNVRLN